MYAEVSTTVDVGKFVQKWGTDKDTVLLVLFKEAHGDGTADFTGLWNTPLESVNTNGTNSHMKPDAAPVTGETTGLLDMARHILVPVGNSDETYSTDPEEAEPPPTIASAERVPVLVLATKNSSDTSGAKNTWDGTVANGIKPRF